MKIIVFASQKGGSGKTTLAACLAVEAEKRGAKTALIDFDKQGTLTRWHSKRLAETPALAEVPYHKFSTSLDLLKKQGFQYCFVDTSPTVSEQNQMIISRADCLVIPVRPSPADFWAMSETMRQAKNERRSFVFAITHAKNGSLLLKEAIEVLGKEGPVASGICGDRISYARAMNGGLTAPELKSAKLEAAEIALLWDNVLEILNS